MTKFDTSYKPKPGIHLNAPSGKLRTTLLVAGIVFIVLSVVILSLSLYESFLGGGKVRLVELPGFHELKLDTPGLYAGVYQHRKAGPLPLKELTQMDVRVMSKDDYQEVPVLMNSSGQTFNRLGVQGLPLFNFVIERAGVYTLSGVYTGDSKGPTASILLFPQTVQNIKQTLIVGGGFFILFLALGIFLLIKRNQWAPTAASKKK